MDATVNGTVMTLIIPLDPKGRPSKSGKRKIAYSTSGFVKVGEYDVSVNVLSPK